MRGDVVGMKVDCVLIYNVIRNEYREVVDQGTNAYKDRVKIKQLHNIVEFFLQCYRSAIRSEREEIKVITLSCRVMTTSKNAVEFKMFERLLSSIVIRMLS